MALRRWMPVALIVLAGGFAHGVVLLTDYRLWDGWAYSLWLSDPQQTPFLWRLLDEIGRPLDALYWLPFRGLVSPHIAAKWAGVAAWVAHVVFMHDCLRRRYWLGAGLATAVAILVVTCPVFRPLGELSIWMNTCAVALFWLGLSILTRVSDGQGGGWRGPLRLVASALLFVSFNLNSNLVFFYGVAAAAVALRVGRVGWRDAARELIGCVRRFPEAAVLPVLFWLWKSWFTPSHGAYLDYNRPTLAPEVLWNGYVVLVTNFLLPFACKPLMRVGVLIASVLAGLLLTSRLHAAGFVGSRFAASDRWPPALAIGAAALVLLGAASFPYVCVGQFLADDAWFGRNNILTPLPLSLLAVGTIAYGSRKAVPTRSRLWFALCVALAAVWGASSLLGYLRLQAFGVKQLSIRAHLRDVIETRAPAVIQLRDYAVMPDGIPYYPPIVWTAMAACCDGVPRTLILDSRVAAPDQQIVEDGRKRTLMGVVMMTSDNVRQAIQQSTVPYAFGDIPDRGPQAVLAVRSTDSRWSSEAIAVRYLMGLWSSPAASSELVREFLTAEVVELEPVGSP
jgi:hypothetical protein